MPKLFAKSGSLFYDEEHENILLYYYPAGDVDTISWPKPNEDHLRSALFDGREIGHLPADCRSVTLPDGTEFPIDA